MSLASDLVLDAFKFDPKAISRQTIELNEACEANSEAARFWHEIGAAQYREMRRNGEGSLPKVVVLESGVNFKIPSREVGREIRCRLSKPEGGQVKGVMMHLHGGGWVFKGEDSNDELLKWMADNCGLAVSIPNCIDAAEWLVRIARPNYGAHLQFIGGESAGAHLSVVTALHPHRAQPSFALKGLILHYGIYELATLLPAVHLCDKNLVTDRPNIELCINTFLPDHSIEQRRNPSISPIYARLSRGALPPALFKVGTEDPMVDDSIMMAAKWQMSGKEAVLKLYPGAPHGFTFYPYSEAATSLGDKKRFVPSKME
ncbi:Alpha/Beta hydrolase protein [Phyllosticta citribraziliensis]